MAPRAPETFDELRARLERALAEGEREVRFGRHHFDHAICVEDGAFRVRRLEYTRAEAEECLREEGIFMPEHAEMISTPKTLVFEAPDIDVLSAWLQERWPL